MNLRVFKCRVLFGLCRKSVLGRMTNSCEPFSIIRGNPVEVLKQLHIEVDCVVTARRATAKETTEPAATN